MNDELRKALSSYIEKQAKDLDLPLTPAQLGSVILKLDETLTRDIGRGLQRRMLESCGTFDCPNKFDCDWF